MQNAQDLLDSFGSPPPDVCLDWAWQLVTLAQAGQLPKHFSWTDLHVSKQGDITPRIATAGETTSRSAAVSQSSSFRECFIQLLRWSGFEKSVDSNQLFSTLENLQAVLSDLTSQRLAVSRVGALAMTATDTVSETEALHETPVVEVVQSDDCLEAGDPATEDLGTTSQPSDRFEELQPSDETALVTTERSPAPARNVGRRSPVVLLATAGTAVLLVSLVGFWWLRSGNGSERIADSNLSNSNLTAPAANGGSGSEAKNGKSTSSRSGRPQKSNKSSTSELDQLLGGVPANDASADSFDSLATPSASNVSPGELSIVSSASDKKENSDDSAMAQVLRDVKPSPSLAIPSDLTDIDRPSIDRPSIPASTNDAQPPMLDVASETSQESVAKLLASSSTSDAKINTMSDPSSVDSQTTKPPVLLSVEDLVQIQEIPNKLRVRQPVWELRLSSTSSMEIEPSDIQTLSEKTTVRWLLSSKELKPRKGQEPTKVAVIAELANRRGDIRWTIVAGTQDLPNMRFPMSQERLDQLLNLLQNYQQRLGVSVDQIKAAMDLPNFPKEQRTYWTAQRKSFENEAKLTTRARQVVADAAMLTSWMDRTIEVHGKLLDTVGSKSEAVLEFGQAELKQVNPLK